MLAVFQRVKTWRDQKNQIPFIYIVTLFLMITGNYALFHSVTNIYPLRLENLPLLVSLVWVFTALTALFFLVVCHGRLTRWLMAVFVLLAAQTAYYMDHYGVLIDTVMIDNVMHTDRHEAMGLISVPMVMKVLLLGVLPALITFRLIPSSEATSAAFKIRMRHIGLLLVSIAIAIAPFVGSYTTFVREYKITRFYANPTYPVYSLIKYSVQALTAPRIGNIRKIEENAVLMESPNGKKELIIVVVGETARYDRFSLNGYQRPTNPVLEKQNVLSFSNVSSCGTSTGVSVPCMFSNLGRAKYNKELALSQENILDVLARNGVAVLWRDNNSDSKGVATRFPYEDFKSPTMNPVCDNECRDIGMLSGLDKYILANKNKSILIVLHQMGNHGPEYYRRYTKPFERFKPACQTGELRDCPKSEVDNAYDNAILYTDYFLSQTIDFLKKYDSDYETAMFYVADHGESLGEQGLYLHAMPYSDAPKEQTHVPAILWLGENFKYKLNELIPYKNAALSHDDLFCGLMTAFEIRTETCKKFQ